MYINDKMIMVTINNNDDVRSTNHKQQYRKSKPR